METQSPSISTQTARQHHFALLLTYFVINALFLYLVYSQNFIFGSKTGRWDYPYFTTIAPLSTKTLIVLSLILIPLIYIGSKWIGSHEKLVLAAGFVVLIAIQILIQRVYPVSLATIVQSDVANSFYSPAMRYSPLEVLAQFDSVYPTLPYHARTNMPGKILLFQLFRIFTTSPQVMGYMVIAVSSLGAVFLYGICSLLFKNKLAGWYAFVLYALIPSKLFFFPVLNTVTPVFILACLYLFVLYIEGRRSVYLWLLGGVLYLLILFEPTPLVTGILFIGILLHALGQKKLSKKEIWSVFILPVFGFLAMYLFFSLVFSFNLLKVFANILEDAIDFNAEAKRSYWIWVMENPKEFFVVAGIPVTILFIYLISGMISQLKVLGRNLTRWPIEQIYILSLLVTILTVNFLGINRGEITRLWIYLAAIFQVPTAVFLAKIDYGKVVFYLVACTLVIQSALTLQRVGFIIP